MKSLQLVGLEVYATRLLVGIVRTSSAVLAQTLSTRSVALDAARNSASVLAAQARAAASEAQASAAELPISGSGNAGYAWNGIKWVPPGTDWSRVSTFGVGSIAASTRAVRDCIGGSGERGPLGEMMRFRRFSKAED
jgi:hypothetical protein